MTTLHGLPVGWVVTGAKADEREAFWAVTQDTPAIASALNGGTGRTMIADKNYFGRVFETDLATAGIELLRPARKGEAPRSEERFFKPLHQIIESVNDTLKGQLDLEHHGGRTTAGVYARIGQRILAMTAAIWQTHYNYCESWSGWSGTGWQGGRCVAPAPGS